MTQVPASPIAQTQANAHQDERNAEAEAPEAHLLRPVIEKRKYQQRRSRVKRLYRPGGIEESEREAQDAQGDDEFFAHLGRHGEAHELDHQSVAGEISGGRNLRDKRLLKHRRVRVMHKNVRIEQMRRAIGRWEIGEPPNGNELQKKQREEGQGEENFGIASGIRQNF